MAARSAAQPQSPQATKAGGESGIRTHGRVSPTHAFQACSFNHSDISPREWNQQFTGRRRVLQKQIVTVTVPGQLSIGGIVRFWRRADGNDVDCRRARTVRDLAPRACVYSIRVNTLRVSRTGSPGPDFVISTNVLPPSSILTSRVLSTSTPPLLTIRR